MKRMNKKGQPGYTMNELLIALLILVLIGTAIYLFVTKGTAVVGKYVPSDLMQVASACEISAGLGEYGKPDYCTKPQSISYGDEVVYVNCAFPQVDKYIVDKQLVGSCKSPDDEKSICEQLRTKLGANYKESIKVNNQQCGADLGVKKPVPVTA